MFFINKAVFARLRDRLNLGSQNLLAIPMPLNPFVIPVTDIDKAVLQLKIDFTTVAVAASGAYSSNLVPSFKRWVIHSIRAWCSTGVFTFTVIMYRDGTNDHALDSFTATSDRALFDNTLSTLPSGWCVRVYVNSVTTPGNLVISILYEEEDLGLPT